MHSVCLQILHKLLLWSSLGRSAYSQEHFTITVYANFWGKTECVICNWKIENKTHGKKVNSHVSHFKDLILGLTDTVALFANEAHFFSDFGYSSGYSSGHVFFAFLGIVGYSLSARQVLKKIVRGNILSADVLNTHIMVNWHLSNQGIRWPVSRNLRHGVGVESKGFTWLFYWIRNTHRS